MRELHLFAGAGGGILGGLLLGHRPVCAVEIDPYCRRVLRARQADGYLPADMEIHDDVTKFDGRPWRGRVDIVAGGFPCQDISVAGKGAGLAGARSGLWWEMHRIIREVGPRFVYVENVAALASRGLDAVLGSLADLGFDAEWTVLSAADCGAPHLRRRLWILARNISDASSEGRRQVAGGASGHEAEDAGRAAIDHHQPRGVGARRIPAADVPDAASGQDHGRERGVVAQASGGRQGGDAAAVAGGADDPDANGRRREERWLTQPARVEGARGSVADGLRADRRQLDAEAADSDRSGCAPKPHAGSGEAQAGRRQINAVASGSSRDAADADCERREEQRQPEPTRAELCCPERGGWWEVEPAVGRVADGMADRVGQLRALGNGQVALVAASAWRLLEQRLMEAP